MKKIYKKLLNFAYISIIAISIIILLQIFQGALLAEKSWNSFNFELTILVLGSILLIAIYQKIYTYISKIEEKKANKIKRICLVIYLAILILLAYTFTIVPFVDLKDIIEEVNQMLANGKTISNTYYFSMYSNNKALLIIIYYIFKLGTILNVNSLNQFATLINCLGVFISVYLIVKSIEFKKGNKHALFVLVLFMLCPVLYFYAAYFYTDTLVLPIASLMIFLITLIDVKSHSKYKKIIYLLLLGFFSYISFKIRATAFFILIGYLVVLLYKTKITTYIKTTIPIILGIIASLLCYNAVESTFNFNYQEDINFPATHWIMMGMNQNHRGRWNANDVSLSESAQNKEERQKLNLKILTQRLTEPTPKELIELFKEKTKTNWSAGENEYISHYRILEKYNSIYEYIAGNKQFIVAYILQINRIVLIFMLLITLIFELKYKEYDFLIITLFGGLIFYLFWEVLERYSICFIPIMIIISSKYIDKYFNHKINKIEVITEKNKKKEYNFSKGIKYLKTITILYTIFALVANYSYYTNDKVIIEDKSLRTYVHYSRSLTQSVELNKENTLTQIITPDKKFNSIKFFFTKTHQESETYYLKLYNREGKLLEEHEIYSDKIRDKSLNQVKLKQKYKKDNYEIELSTSSEKGIKISTIGSKYYDYYKTSNLHINEQELEKDLVMLIENQRTSTRLPKIIYILMSLSLIALEIFLFVDIKKIFKLKEDK